MDGLTVDQWMAVGKVIERRGAELDKIFAYGTYVDTTASGFLMHFTRDVVHALKEFERERQENEAWDEKERRERVEIDLNAAD